MLSDDTYRAKLRQTIASVQAWTGFVADVARVEVTDQDTAWRIVMTPKSANACPVEIVLRNDRTYDLAMGGQTYVDRPLPSLDVVLPLLEAVAEGRVVTRRIASAATGLLRERRTVVTLADGTRFEAEETKPSLPAAAADAATESSERHYLPYRRAG